MLPNFYYYHMIIYVFVFIDNIFGFCYLGYLLNKLIFFNQEMFYYKFNLKLPNYIWIGTKSCKKKYLKNPQWLRNIKDRKYPFYRLDTFFSKKKYTNLKFINNGGWHFSNI